MPRGDSGPDRIVACALRLFAQHGVAGTSLQMIATELGVTKAAVYYHFRTKEQIVSTVLAPAFDEFDRLLDQVEGSAPAADRPALLVDGLARQAARHRRLYAVVLRDVSAAQFMRESSAHLRTFTRLHATLAGDRPTSRTEVAVSIFLAGLMGPPIDPELADLADGELEDAIATAGRSLLGLPRR